MDVSGLIGKHVKDESNKEVGRIISFIIDSSGQIEDVLVENRYGNLVTCSVERLKTDRDEVSLASYIDAKVALLSEKFPVLRKKRKVLDTLSENKVIPSEIYQNLCKEFDRALKEMETEAKNLLEDMEKQVRVLEDQIKVLQLGRIFLEIEHGMDTVKDEVYQVSLMSILKEVKNASQRKVSLLRTRDKVSSILLGEEEVPKKAAPEELVVEHPAEPIIEAEPAVSEEKTVSVAESKEEKEPVTVRMSQE